MFDHLYFFGRFNYPHYGYLYVIRETLNQLKPRRGLTVVLSAETATWEKRALPMNQRLEMFRLAMGELPSRLQKDIHFSRIEESMHAGGYTLPTLTQLSRQNPGKTGLVMGADAALGIPELHPGFTSWKDWQKILRLASLIILPRGRYATQDAVRSALPKELPAIVLATKPTEIELHASSTAIQAGNFSFLPKSVYNYCVQHHLV